MKKAKRRKIPCVNTALANLPAICPLAKILILPDIFSLSDYGLPEMEVALRGMVSFPDQNFLTLPKEPTDSIRELSFLQADKLFV